MMPDFTAEQARFFRLVRHGLLQRVPRRRLSAVIRDVAGIQAQLPSAAYLSLWARVEGIARNDVENLLYRRKTLARTWCMRGTVHIVTREDRALFSTALGTRVGGMKQYLLRRGLLTERQYRRLRQAVLDALGDQPLDRVGITDRIAADLPGASKWFGSWGGILRLVAQDGLIVIGRSHAGRTTFARVDRWWHDAERPLIADDPLLELMRRYLRGYGPASATDFAYWSGLTVREGRSLLERLGDEVVEVLINGKKAHLLRRDLRKLKGTQVRQSVRLLPHFDVFLLGHRDKSDLLDPDQYKKVFRAAGWISPAILLNGKVIGTWSHEVKGSKLLVSLEPFGAIPRWARSPLREEAESLRRFLGAQSLAVRF